MDLVIARGQQLQLTLVECLLLEPVVDVEHTDDVGAHAEGAEEDLDPAPDGLLVERRVDALPQGERPPLDGGASGSGQVACFNPVSAP